MYTWIIKEISLRKTNALLILAAVFIATAVLSALTAVSTAYDKSIDKEFVRRKADLEKEMKNMWNEYRKMTKDLGFNVLILPKDQNLADFYADDFSSKYMPESYAQKLAASTSITIQHILPALIQKTYWPEEKRSVLIYGVRGELTRMHFPEANKKSPILQPVNAGEVVCGYEISKGLGLSPGSTLRIHGKEFVVSKCHEQRGNRDDITLWLNLAAAQNMFQKKDKINAILALECRCTADKNLPNVAKIRADLEKILPGTQVLEFMSQVIARAEARWAAHRTKEETLGAEIAHAHKARAQRTLFLNILLILVISAAVGMVSLLTVINVRGRLHEIGILRAIGFSSMRVFLMFSGKLLVLGIAGATAGLITGHFSAQLIANNWDMVISEYTNTNTVTLRIVIGAICAGMVCIASGFVPVIKGLQKSPMALLTE